MLTVPGGSYRNCDGISRRNFLQVGAPLLALLPETPPRGGGIEIRLYDTDPDAAAAVAKAAGATILQLPTDKPHGLRECYILCDNGYAWVPSRPTDPLKEPPK